MLIYTGADAGEPPDVPAPVEVVRLEVAALTEMLADLHARGVRKLLSEGGPTMHGAPGRPARSTSFTTIAP